MSLLKGLQVIRARRATVASTLMKEEIRISAVGIVHTIASVIQNQDAIKSSKLLKSAITKLEFSAMHAFRTGKTKLELNNEEEGAIRSMVDVAKTAVGEVMEMGAKFMFGALSKAVKLAIVPVFRIFVLTLTTVLRIITLNPYTLAATALIAAAWGGRKLYLNYQADKAAAEGTQFPDAPPAMSSNNSGNGTGTSSNRMPSKERDLKMQQIIAEAAKRNGIPIDLALRVASIESSLNPNVGSSTSSAKGLFGMTKSTWKGLGGVPGTENDPYANADLGTKYLKQNYVSLKKALGREVFTYEVYASHYFGPGVAAMLRAQDTMADRPIEDGLRMFNSASRVAVIMSQNPNLRGKTVGEVLAVFKRKAGDYSMDQARGMDQANEQRLSTAAVVGTGTGSFIIPATGTFTSPFGPRTYTDQFGKATSSDHKGIDIANAIGTPIFAADAGTVVVSSMSSQGYGTRIDIDHGNGFLTRYGHSSRLLASVGDQVSRGQQIAAMGNAGHSSGPHLHFEVRQVTASLEGSPVDPALYLPGFPSTKNSHVTAGDMRTAQAPSSSASSIDKQYIRRGDKIVALNGG